jgi:hypothetical protein
MLIQIRHAWTRLEGLFESAHQALDVRDEPPGILEYLRDLLSLLEIQLLGGRHDTKDELIWASSVESGHAREQCQRQLDAGLLVIRQRHCADPQAFGGLGLSEAHAAPGLLEPMGQAPAIGRGEFEFHVRSSSPCRGTRDHDRDGHGYRTTTRDSSVDFFPLTRISLAASMSISLYLRI